MEDKRISELAQKFLCGQASPEEEAELHAWWDRETNEEDELVVVTSYPETSESVRERMLERLNREINEERPARIKRMDRGWLVAATVLALVAATGIIIAITRENPITSVRPDALEAAHFIKPGANKATLELSSGQLIELDSAAYTVAKPQKGTFNTIHTPKGGQYHAQLPDGSNVWLNAASSIRFPGDFGKERRVELTGEAYFEVAVDAHRPFRVMVSRFPDTHACEITVLGTEFDIDAYAEGPSVKTTLLKGSLKVTAAANRSQLLKPGQQALVDKEHHLIVNESPDSVMVLAWREGFFRFRDDSIQDVMNQISRWFDVHVIYSGKTREHFSSTLSRKADLYDDLQTLQKTGRVHFEVRGRTVTVFPH